MDLTLDLVLTAGGAVASSALITGIIQMLKQLPGIGSRLDEGNEKLASFGMSAVLVIVAFIGTGREMNFATGFLAFLAWYGIARLSMGIYDDATRARGSVTGAPAKPE